MFSLQNVEEAMVLLGLRQKKMKKQWFYCVFAQKYWQSIGFTAFSLKKVAFIMNIIARTCKKRQKKTRQSHWLLHEQLRKRIILFINPMLFEKQNDRKTNPAHGSGEWICNTRQIYYEEHLQPSCLGNQTLSGCFGLFCGFVGFVGLLLWFVGMLRDLLLDSDFSQRR